MENKQFPEELKDWPKAHRGLKWSYVCSKEKPMPLQFAKGFGTWEHDDVHETDADSEYYIEYKCHSCGHVWRSEMPD